MILDNRVFLIRIWSYGRSTGPVIGPFTDGSDNQMYGSPSYYDVTVDINKFMPCIMGARNQTNANPTTVYTYLLID